MRRCQGCPLNSRQHRVTRVRSASLNQYRLRLPRGGRKGDEQVFEGFGSSVPAEIQRALRVYSVSIGDLLLLVNLAEQLDGPFLGKSAPSTLRAKVLGRLAGSEVLDVASNRLGTDILRAARAQRLEHELESVQSEIDKYLGVIYADRNGLLTNWCSAVRRHDNQGAGNSRGIRGCLTRRQLPGGPTRSDQRFRVLRPWTSYAPNGLRGCSRCQASSREPVSLPNTLPRLLRL